MRIGIDPNCEGVRVFGALAAMTGAIIAAVGAGLFWDAGGRQEWLIAGLAAASGATIAWGGGLMCGGWIVSAAHDGSGSAFTSSCRWFMGCACACLILLGGLLAHMLILPILAG